MHQNEGDTSLLKVGKVHTKELGKRNNNNNNKDDDNNNRTR